MDAEEKAQALARLAEMKQRAEETTQALGLPKEDASIVLRVIYSDLLPPEAREAIAQQGKKHPQSRKAAQTKIVTIGSRVTLQASDGEKRQYRLVDSSQSQPHNAKVHSYTGYELMYPISYKSLPGKALMGRSVGDRVQLPRLGKKTPIKDFIILDIK